MYEYIKREHIQIFKIGDINACTDKIYCILLCFTGGLR